MEKESRDWYDRKKVKEFLQWTEGKSSRSIDDMRELCYEKVDEESIG